MRMRDTHLTHILTNEVVALYLLLPRMLISVTRSSGHCLLDQSSSYSWDQSYSDQSSGRSLSVATANVN